MIFINILEYENYQETKFHSDSLFPYNTYLCSIPLDFDYVPLHWHNEMEIIYIKKGKGQVVLDFETHYVEGGDIIIVIPGQLHEIMQLDNFSMEYENIIFSLDMLTSKYDDSLNDEFFVPLLSGSISFQHFITRDDEYYSDFSTCLNRADNICSSFPTGYKLALKGCIFEFLYALMSHSSISQGNKTDKNLDKIKSILKYIETNYQQNISIEEISDVCGFSTSHFMKFFKNNMGTSFVNYLNDYRLSMASRMLVSSQDNIIDIAADCGYDNLSYFNRIFKKKYGLTPKEYRKK